jgi:hypothetical protein
MALVHTRRAIVRVARVSSLLLCYLSLSALFALPGTKHQIFKIPDDWGKIQDDCGTKGHLYRDYRKPKKDKSSASQQQAMAVQAPTVPNATAPVQLTRQQLQQQQPAPDEAHFAFTIKSAVPSKNAVWVCHKNALHAKTTIDGVTVEPAPFGTFNYRAVPIVSTTTMAPYAGESLKVVPMIMDTGATWSVVDPEKLDGALITDKVTVAVPLIVPGGGRVVA